MSIEGLILAAGLSSRMGRHKLLDRIDGLSVIQHTVMTLLPVCDRVTVVTGHGAELVSRELAALADMGSTALLGQGDKVRIVRAVFNVDYALGMLSSFQAGIGAIETSEINENAETTVNNGPPPLVLMMPGDMPFVSSETCKSLILAAHGDVDTQSRTTVYTVIYTVNTAAPWDSQKIGSQQLWVPSYQQRAGHPVAFYLNEDLKGHILGAPATGTLKSVLAPMRREFVTVLDPGILQDLDTPEDYKRLVALGGRV